MNGNRNPLNWPETNLAFFGFLLHFAWEMLQLPLFVVAAELTAREAILHCTRATGGDLIITFAAFLGASVSVRTRHWIVRRDPTAIAVFILSGLSITIAFEYLAIGPLSRWTYAESMPIVPILQIGATPILQWLLLPVILLWITRRQLLAARFA